MSKTIHRRRMARQDLVDVYRYYAREAGFRVAQRFFAQAEATFIRLAGMNRQLVSVLFVCEKGAGPSRLKWYSYDNGLGR